MCHPRESRTATGEPEREDDRAWWRVLIDPRTGESTVPDEPSDGGTEPADGADDSSDESDDPSPDREKEPVLAGD